MRGPSFRCAGEGKEGKATKPGEGRAHPLHRNAVSEVRAKQSLVWIGFQIRICASLVEVPQLLAHPRSPALCSPLPKTCWLS